MVVYPHLATAQKKQQQEVRATLSFRENGNNAVTLWENDEFGAIKKLRVSTYVEDTLLKFQLKTRRTWGWIALYCDRAAPNCT